MTPAMTPPTHLAQLYAISNELLHLDEIESSFVQIIGLIDQAVPLRSAFLGLDRSDHASAFIVEDARDAEDRREAAREHARDAFAYLTDQRHLLRDEVASVHPLAGSRAGAHGDDSTMLVLPLVVARRPVFGVLQIETASRADEDALMLASVVANQLSVAVDRHTLAARELADAERRAAVDSARRSDADARREEAETLRNRYIALMDGLDRAFVWECESRSLSLTYVSARAATILGGTRDQWLHSESSLIDLTLSEDRAAVREALVWAATTGRAQHVDHRCIDTNGRTVWLHTSVRLAERAGSKRRLQGVSFDVTAAKEGEIALRDQLEFNRAITSSLGEGLIVADREGRMTSVNAAAATLLELDPAELVDRRFRAVVELRGADGTPIAADECPLIRAASAGASHADDDVTFVRGDLTFSASYTATPLRQRGVLSGAVMVFRDVSALKRAEQRQRLFADLGAVIGATLDPETAVADLLRFVSHSFCDVAILETLADDGSVAHAEYYARAGMDAIAELLLHPGTDADRRSMLLSREPSIVRFSADAREAPQSGERARLWNAGVRWLAIVPLIARERAIGALRLYIVGDPGRFLADDRTILLEIARRASIAIDNARLHEDAQRARRVRDDMLAVVSHDLRNPLGAIMLQTDLLLAHGDRAPTALQSIKRAATKMSRLIQDLLDVASIEAGRFSVDRLRVNVPALVQEALETLSPVAAAKGVTLECVIADDVPEVSADAGRFDQVIGNLVGNALKFTPMGGVVRVTAEAAQNGVRFAVLDTGSGIAPENLPHVFDRFWQARHTARLGTGLGLFISQGIVEAHGDAIVVDSTVGIGTVFSFLLPFAEPSEATMTPDELRTAALASRARRVAELEDLSERRGSRPSIS